MVLCKNFKYVFSIADDRDRLRRDLELIVGEKNVSSSESVLAQHGQDEGPHKGCNKQKYN